MSIFRRRLMIANALKKSDSNIHYPGLIAAWSAKGKSNGDTDRAVLRDLTGNGHDLTLNNFAFGGMSGYGGFKYGNGKYAYTSIRAGQVVFEKTPVNGDFSFKTTGLKDALDGAYTLTLSITAYFNDGSTGGTQFNHDTNEYNPGKEYYTYHIPEGATHISMEFYGMGSNPNCDVTIEFLPEYPDALVFDGVDDHGVNSEMPILTDYTLIVKREILDDFSVRCMVASYTGSPTIDYGPFWFEYKTDIVRTYSFGKGTPISLNKSKFVSYQTKSKYNGIDISFNDSLSSGKTIVIGGFHSYRNIDINMAFYSAYLFDRSLDEQEIKAFIRKYIDADYYLPSKIVTPTVYYDFTNGDNMSETRGTIVDLSGNGNDAKAKNFAWNDEGSGYKDGALQFDGTDDYVELLTPKKFRTVFIVVNWETINKMIYGQRDMSASPAEQNNAIYTSIGGTLAYRARNVDGITYVNGKKNVSLISDELDNRKHCITEIFTNTGTNNCTGTIIGASTGPQHFMKMSLYKFLAFEEELTEKQIQYVIEKYNLLDGVDEIEIS